jgi:N utilization substance protein B
VGIAGRRRLAREIVLETLYRMSMVGDDPMEILEDVLERTSPEESVAVFARRLLGTTLEHLEEIDEAIAATVENWDVSRIASIDRNILRYAICELRYLPDIPPFVTIDEAIEIAKDYSTAESGRFVNGILDHIMKSEQLGESAEGLPEVGGLSEAEREDVP